MPVANITKARFAAQFIYISRASWPHALGVAGKIQILLGRSGIVEQAHFTTPPGGYGWVTCHSLYAGGPRGGLPLPLQLNDQVEYDLVGSDIRILAITKGGAGAAPVHAVAPQPPPPVANPPAPLPVGFGFNRQNVLKEIVRQIHSDPFQRRRRYAGIISSVNGAPVVTGWENRVREYAYAKNVGPDFIRAYRDTLPMILNLDAIRIGHLWSAAMPTPPYHFVNSISAIAKQVCIWGGVEQVSYADAWKVVRDAIVATNNGSLMNSGWTKVASFATDRMVGNEQTIWDSRVATSIIWRIDQVLHQGVLSGHITAAQAQAQASQFALGTVASLNVGTRPRALHYRWPNGYGKWRFHFSGSALVREVVAILNDPANGYPCMPQPTFDANFNHTGAVQTDWTVFGVGLVLFMDGW